MGLTRVLENELLFPNRVRKGRNKMNPWSVFYPLPPPPHFHPLTALHLEAGSVHAWWMTGWYLAEVIYFSCLLLLSMCLLSAIRCQTVCWEMSDIRGEQTADCPQAEEAGRTGLTGLLAGEIDVRIWSRRRAPLVFKLTIERIMLAEHTSIAQGREWMVHREPSPGLSGAKVTQLRQIIFYCVLKPNSRGEKKPTRCFHVLLILNWTSLTYKVEMRINLSLFLPAGGWGPMSPLSIMRKLNTCEMELGKCFVATRLWNILFCWVSLPQLVECGCPWEQWYLAWSEEGCIHIIWSDNLPTPLYWLGSALGLCKKPELLLDVLIT